MEEVAGDEPVFIHSKGSYRQMRARADAFPGAAGGEEDLRTAKLEGVIQSTDSNEGQTILPDLHWLGMLSDGGDDLSRPS